MLVMKSMGLKLSCQHGVSKICSRYITLKVTIIIVQSNDCCSLLNVAVLCM